MHQSYSHTAPSAPLTTGDITRLYNILPEDINKWLVTKVLKHARKSDAEQSHRLVARLDLEMFLFTKAAGKYQRQPQVLDVESLVLLPELQLRVRTFEEKIIEYAVAIKDGADFPPILVVVVDNQFVVVDGYHRVKAHKRVDKAQIKAFVINECTMAEATYLAATANRTNGITLTKNDRMKAARALIALPEVQKLSLREAAQVVGMSHTQVARLRRKILGGSSPSASPSPKPELSIRDEVKLQLHRAITAWQKIDPIGGEQLLTVFNENERKTDLHSQLIKE